MHIFKNLINLLRPPPNSSRFKKNFASVFKANFFISALPALSAPLLTRLFTPEDFGVYALFNSLVLFISTVSIFKLDWSIPNTYSRKRASELVVAALMILLTSILFLCVILAILPIELIASTTYSSLIPYKWLIPVAIAGTSISYLLQSWYVREADLTFVSQYKVLQNVTNSFGQLASGILGYGALALVVSALIALWVATIWLYTKAKLLTNLMSFKSFIRSTLTLKSFIKEAVFSTLVSLLNQASLTALPILMVFFYSPMQLGWYALMHRLALMPMKMFTSAISQSFWAEAAERIKTEPAKLLGLYIRTTKKLTIIAATMAVVIAPAPLYIKTIFGEQWAPASWILLALIPMLIGQLIVSPLSHLVIHRRQHWQFTWDFFRCSSIIAAVYILGSNNYPFVYVVLTVSVIHMFFYAILFVLNLLAFEKKKV